MHRTEKNSPVDCLGARVRVASGSEASKSLQLRQQKQNICLPTNVLFLFIQAAGLAYHRRTKCGAYHQGRRAALVSHHAVACIYLRLDEIQCFALVICNSFGIDDIHAFGVIGT